MSTKALKNNSYLIHYFKHKQQCSYKLSRKIKFKNVADIISQHEQSVETVEDFKELLDDKYQGTMQLELVNDFKLASLNDIFH